VPGWAVKVQLRVLPVICGSSETGGPPFAETALVPAAHLTCVGSDRGEVDEVARQYWDAGIRHIVALRGDAPRWVLQPALGHFHVEAAKLVPGEVV
jgi:hypothetical protein